MGTSCGMYASKLETKNSRSMTVSSSTSTRKRHGSPAAAAEALAAATESASRWSPGLTFGAGLASGMVSTVVRSVLASRESALVTTTRFSSAPRLRSPRRKLCSESKMRLSRAAVVGTTNRRSSTLAPSA
eukprot:Amastigsp_a511147_6.p3 type:complete len:130 gc:universal Amastigsp_a511147_6:650-261(-)